jgi:putative heme-binding domain-containing protein
MSHFCSASRDSPALPFQEIAVIRLIVLTCGLGSASVVATTGFLHAEEAAVIPHRQDRPPNQPYSPEEALRRMTVPEGFAVELVAAEPEIVNPVAMTFDDRGRIWVCESLEYPNKPAGPGRDRIKILEDTDHDGNADKVTVFAEGLNIPSGIAVGYGGVWVLNAPDLLFMKEENGRAVSREVVVTGFGRTDVHELPSSLTWGPDGWLYGLNGVFNPSRVESEGKIYEFTCAMYRIHPRTHEFEVVCEGTSNPWGLVWDTEGSALVSACHWANDHIFHFVETGYYHRQAGPYPPHTMIIGAVSDHGHQKTAYCGLAYFDSDAYPAEYRERLYMGNIHGGCINVDVLERNGSTYRSRGAPDFLSAHDAWFMPVSQKVGPDGCLYVLDWYDRYHCYQDANRDPEGIDRLKGRLYRVRYQDSPRAPAFDLARETDEQLIARLSSTNIFFREAAQRLLTERASGSSDAPADVSSRAGLRGRLERLVLEDTAGRKARLHALWALVGTGSLGPRFHGRLLAHPDATFRAWGVRAAGKMGTVAPLIYERVVHLARDASPDVQLQVAIAARKVGGLDPLVVLVDVLSHCGQDKLIPSIVWPNLHPLIAQDPARFVKLAKAADLDHSPALVALLPRSVGRMLSEPAPDVGSIRAVVELLLDRDVAQAKECLSVLSAKTRELAEDVVSALRVELAPALASTRRGDGGDGLYLAARLLAIQLGLEAGEADYVRSVFCSADQPAADRLSALDALIVCGHPKLLDDVDDALRSAPPDLAAEMLHGLGKSDDRRLADVVLSCYPELDDDVQSLAIDLLMQREVWVRRLLDAIKDERLPATVLNANHLRKILDTNDREAIWAVEAAWGTIRRERNSDQEQVVAEMREALHNAVGDPFAGQRAFRKLCAQCHTIHGEGADVGPDLTTNGRASFEQLLSNVFDPSLVIGPAYQVTLVVTNDGRNLTGIVVEDNDQRIVLKLPGGALESIARANVHFTKVSPLSMMPEGVEDVYSHQEIADLFAFLCLDKHPSDPSALPIPGAPDFGRGRE